MADVWDWNPPIPPPLLQQQSTLAMHPALPATQANRNSDSGAPEMTTQFLHPQLQQRESVTIEVAG